MSIGFVGRSIPGNASTKDPSNVSSDTILEFTKEPGICFWGGLLCVYVCTYRKKDTNKASRRQKLTTEI